jgi:hypothetical protein
MNQTRLGAIGLEGHAPGTREIHAEGSPPSEDKKNQGSEGAGKKGHRRLRMEIPSYPPRHPSTVPETVNLLLL